MKNLSIIILTVVAIAAIFLVIFFLRLPHDTYLWREIHNTGHTPLFGIMSLLILALLKALSPASTARPVRNYLLSLILIAVFGGAVEFVQFWIPGDPDIWDFLRDIAGAVSFLGVYSILESRKKSNFATMTKTIKFIILFVSAISFLAAMTPLAHWTGSYIHRNRIFPTICDFDPVWNSRFLYTRNAQLGPAPDSICGRFTDQNCQQITFRPSQYPAFIIEEPFPDWRNHKNFHFEIYSGLDTSVEISLRIEDFQHNQEYNDRFNFGLRIFPGLNSFDIPIEKIKSAPAKREMNIAAIRSIHFFAFNPARPFSLFISALCLK